MVSFIQSRRSLPWLIALATVGAVIFALSLITLMLPYSRIVEENSSQDLTCLQIPFTQERAAEIISSYDRQTRQAARALHLPGDLIFPVGYALLYTGLIGLVVRHQRGRWLRWGLVAMAFPVAALLLDWIENLFIVRMLTISLTTSVAAIPAWMPLLGSIAGALKYLFLSILTPLYGIAAIGRSLLLREPDRTPSLLLTYAVVAALLLFNLVQTISQVPACLVALA